MNDIKIPDATEVYPEDIKIANIYYLYWQKRNFEWITLANKSNPDFYTKDMA